MYGLLLENIIQYIQDNFGVDKWNEIRRLAQIEETSFHTHTVYPDVYTKNIIDKACKILRISEKQLLIGIGESFVTFIGRYGYDVVLSALGREFSDFLNSLDDLHEYLRLSYPRLKPPSYFCDNENEYGLILHYRTKRNFLLWYTVGQILKVAKLFYSTDVEIELLSENQEINEYHFILQLSFDNRVYLERLHNGGLGAVDYHHHQQPRSISRLSMTSPSPYNILQQQQQQLRDSQNNNQNSTSSSALYCRTDSPLSFTSAQQHMFSGRAYSPSSLSSHSISISSTNSFLNATSQTNQQSKANATQFYSLNSQSSLSFSPITLDIFMDIFPFSIVYDSKMLICHIGSCLKMVCSNILGQNMTRVFSLIKPKIDFNWESILRHTNTTFELKLDILLKSQNKSSRIIRELRNISRSSIAEYAATPSGGGDLLQNQQYHPHQSPEEGAMVKYIEGCQTESSAAIVQQQSSTSPTTSANNNGGYHVTLIHTDHHSPNGDNPSFLKLKGQMIYFDCWKCIVFLGAPNVANLDTLIKTGLYLNDLSMHDFSRDMVLAGQQQSAELKLALDQELRKSRQLEITIRKLDEERRRSDELLYQMITDKLRVGEKNIETCQYFSSVTILFSDIINFTEICSKIAPMDVVNMLNETYTCFDHLTEKHDIYKVETVGDAYMIAGGLPVHQEESSYSHARKVCLMARDMIQACHQIRDPSRGRHIKIRIGIHTGPVVGGIVGQKMPRYCLFGDTVNTSSRLETTSMKMKIQISEVTQRLLDPNEWIIRERGTIRLKGKGMMKTYWLEYRKDRYKSECGRSTGHILSNMGTSFAGVDEDDDASDIEQQTQGYDGDVNYIEGTNTKKYSINQRGYQHQNSNNGIHDSNYSLFVDHNNRFKFPNNCLIS